MIDKVICMTFSLIEVANHVIRIDDQWKNRINSEKINFRIITTFECNEFFHFRKFSYFVQKLIVDQLKLVHQNLQNDEESIDEMPDQLICSVDCLFYRQYQFSCKHLWHYELVFNSFQEIDWINWIDLFEDEGFEIYETTIKINVERQENCIDGSNRHMLKIRKVLNHIKKKYYEIAEHTANWIVEKRNSKIRQWIDWLNKLTNSIKRQKAEKALQKLKKKAKIDEAEKRILTRKRRRDEDDD